MYFSNSYAIVKVYIIKNTSMEESSGNIVADIPAVIDEKNNVSKNFLVKHFRLLSLFSLIVGLLLSYFGFNFFDTTQEEILVTQENTGATVSSGQIEPEKKAMTKKEEIWILMDEFMEHIWSWSLEEALQTYEKIIVISDRSPYFTAKDSIEVKQIYELDSLRSKITSENDSINKSKLLLDEGILLYDIWNKLYFLDNRRFWLPIIYYWLSAIHSLDESNKLNESSLAHRYKWVVLLDIGTLSNMAISELERAITLDNTDDIAFYKLGNAYKGLGKYDKAIAMYLSGIAINPNNDLLQINLWWAYFDIENTDKWFETMNHLITNCVDYCNMAYYNFSLYLLDDGGKDYDKMALLLNEAIRYGKLKNEVYRDAYRLKWYILYKQGKLSEAIESLKLSFNDPNDRKTAVNMFNQNSHEEVTYYWISKIYMELWEIKLGKQYLDQGLAKFPKDSDLIELFNESNNTYVKTRNI